MGGRGPQSHHRADVICLATWQLLVIAFVALVLVLRCLWP